jgi:hypothetical protein
MREERGKKNARSRGTDNRRGTDNGVHALRLGHRSQSPESPEHEDPVEWVKERLGFTADLMQEQVLRTKTNPTSAV